MDLYGTGFNAHGQLFSLDPSQNGVLENLDEFTFLAHARKDIEVWHTCWSQTVLCVDGKIIFQGHEASVPDRYMNAPDGLASPFGTIDGLAGFARVHDGSLCFIDAPSQVEHEAHPRISQVALTLTARTGAILDTSSPGGPGPQSVIHIVHHPSLAALRAWYRDPSDLETRPEAHHIVPPGAFSRDAAGRKLAATATGWVLLTEQSGNVYTWGDTRLPSLLGRGTDEVDAATPGLVGALGGLDVVKIATCAGGGLVGAVTQAGEAFLWGRQGVSISGNVLQSEGEEAGDIETLNDNDGEPSMIRLPTETFDEDMEIVDIAVGKAHVLVLDNLGEVYGIGDNSYGQLGLGNVVKFQATWKRLGLLEGLKSKGRKAVSVACGDLSSFVTFVTKDE